MRILLVGGSGRVGTMVIPYLRPEHALRVLDPVPPLDPDVEHVAGHVRDEAAVRRALDGMDALVYMVLAHNPDGTYAGEVIDPQYAANVTGLHHVLHAAAETGLRRAVYLSTLSVHQHHPQGFPSEDATPPDAPDLYGFTKWLGEVVCDYFARARGMTVVALRLNAPVPREDWHRHGVPGRPNPLTAAPDVARAISLALTAPLTGFHAVWIAGDYEGKWINCSRAKRLLGWEPLERPRPPASPS
jgi:nucleoside-diphosphate-sugar epimerase